MTKTALFKWRALSTTQLTVLMGTCSLLIILAALAFEHIGGYKPCFLCYRQRWAYYGAFLLCPLALWCLWRKQISLTRLLLLLLALIFFANMIYGGYHAGVEWGLWPGPSSCSGTISDDTGVFDLTRRLESIQIVPCGVASWRMFGISFAGYNALFSAALAILALISWRRLPTKP